jgi:hypothetical protein
VVFGMVANLLAVAIVSLCTPATLDGEHVKDA